MAIDNNASSYTSTTIHEAPPPHKHTTLNDQESTWMMEKVRQNRRTFAPTRLEPWTKFFDWHKPASSPLITHPPHVYFHEQNWSKAGEKSSSLIAWRLQNHFFRSHKPCLSLSILSLSVSQCFCGCECVWALFTHSTTHIVYIFVWLCSVLINISQYYGEVMEAVVGVVSSFPSPLDYRSSFRFFGVLYMYVWGRLFERWKGVGASRCQDSPVFFAHPTKNGRRLRKEETFLFLPFRPSPQFFPFFNVSFLPF